MTEKIKKAKAPQIYWEIEVKDKNGKVISKKQASAKSWLVAFITLLKGQFAVSADAQTGTNNVSVVDEGGTGRNFPPFITYGTNSFSCLGAAANVNEGIVVGSGNTANLITTYMLTSKILHGSTSGLLLYGASSIEDVTNPSGNDLQFRITRTFTNNTGATVTVKEIGIIGRCCATGVVLRNFMIARDVLPSPTDVPDGATLTIRYVAKITVA